MPENTTEKEQIEKRLQKQEITKSQVRVTVTYIATGFLFVVSTVLIIWFMIKDGENAKDDALAVFNTILPVATGIVTYWFATRSNKKTNEQDDT
jgi:flagellar basal body-associated protein FliL